MLDLYELKQLIAFAELGTLSKVAEQFHVSTPSVTRSMKHLEETFGATLFVRGKNKIALNETGELAVQCGRKLLEDARQTMEQVRSFDERCRTIVVKSCAPAPLWEMLKKINTEQGGKMISSAICQNEEVIASLKEGNCDIGILPFPVEKGCEFMKENLFVCVPENHELATHESLTFKEINGFNFLIRTELGFWDTLCREKMSASKFLVQTDITIFDELIKESALPCFTTDYVQTEEGVYKGRVNIPLTDPEANVTFYVISNKAV